MQQHHRRPAWSACWAWLVHAVTSPLLVLLIVMEAYKIWTIHTVQHGTHVAHQADPRRSADAAQWGGAPASTNRWAIMDCINQNQPGHAATATTWDTAVSTQPPSLRVVSVWWSAKARSVPLTVTTQLSAGRMWQLRALCMLYPGPVSAALHVAVLKGHVLAPGGTLAFAVEQAEAMFRELELVGQCQLDLLLVREVYDDRDAKLWYPINQMRNYARLQARTPLIAVVDADLLVSPGLASDWGSGGDELMRLVHGKAQVCVLPAFQVAGSSTGIDEAISLAEHAAVLPKTQLHELFAQGYVVPFDPGKPGHAATDYSKWFQSRAPYKVHYTPRYEPWFVCDRHKVPWHDVRFKGYGLNKILHLEHLNASGYRFVVHATSFLMHRPHHETKAKKMVLDEKKRQRHPRMAGTPNGQAGGPVGADDAAHPSAELPDSAYAHVQQLGEQLRRELASGSYCPYIDSAVQACLHSLPWWQAE